MQEKLAPRRTLQAVTLSYHLMGHVLRILVSQLQLVLHIPPATSLYRSRYLNKVHTTLPLYHLTTLPPHHLATDCTTRPPGQH